MALAASCLALLQGSEHHSGQLGVQRIGGVPTESSVVWPGVLAPLTRRQAAVAEALLRDDEADVTAWGGPPAAFGAPRAFSAHALLVHAEALEASEGECMTMRSPRAPPGMDHGAWRVTVRVRS